MSVADLWRRLEHGHLKPLLRRAKPWRRIKFENVRVHYRSHLDGGGSTFGQEYVTLLKAWGMPKRVRAFEWCAGPGFIGFALLGADLCDTLCLADINPEAVDACRRTIRDNNLAERVSVYQSNNLDNIPASERFDLVVGNPPHFVDASPGELRYHDPDWRIHRAFFATIGKFLLPGAVIVLQENNFGSTVATFRPMIESAGLRIAGSYYDEPERTRTTKIYYIAIVRGEDPPPDWAVRSSR